MYLSGRAHPCDVFKGVFKVLPLVVCVFKVC